ncbi:MAG: MarC family protein [Candidatus Omnitrophica bacterium]|nr:MarC family protein [Candidatus Omnitrophota bacterium]
MNDISSVMRSMALLLVLLNPFLVVVYLIDVMEKYDKRRFTFVLVRAGVIATLVFCVFAILGDYIFANVMQANFASFQIFGGIVFLLIALQFVFRGPRAIEILRGESEHVAGAIAMPILIGPGTISVSVLIGEKHSPLTACAVVVVALGISIATILILKRIHDFVRPRRESVIERYIEVTGRITAMFAGTISVEMIIRGIRTWAGKL